MEKFKPGQKLYARGYNMRGKTTIEKIIFIQYKNSDCGHFDCIVESKGIKSYSNSNSLYTNQFEVPQTLTQIS
jgi:hypothetical protein